MQQKKTRPCASFGKLGGKQTVSRVLYSEWYRGGLPRLPPLGVATIYLGRALLHGSSDLPGIAAGHSCTSEDVLIPY